MSSDAPPDSAGGWRTLTGDELGNYTVASAGR